MTIARYASLGIACLLAAAEFAGPALADGMPSHGRIADSGPAAAPGPNWNGFYLGVGGGFAATDFLLTGNFGSDFHNQTFRDRADMGNTFGAVAIGYDRVIRPGWVAGVFADYDFGGSSYADNGIPYSSVNSWAAGGRLGYLVSPSSLLYGTAGYTQARFEYAFDVATTPTFNGYFVGAGVETFLRPNWTLKFEYRFSQFDGEFAFPTDDKGANERFEPSTQSARLVLSYKFGQHD